MVSNLHGSSGPYFAILNDPAQSICLEGFLDCVVGANFRGKFLCRENGREQDDGDVPEIRVVADGPKVGAQVKTWHAYVVENDVRALIPHRLKHAFGVRARDHMVPKCS